MDIEEMKEQIKIILVENGLQWKHDFTENLLNDLYFIFKSYGEKMKSKRHYYCLVCGIQKIKGFWEGGCNSWGKHWEKHLWRLGTE